MEHPISLLIAIFILIYLLYIVFTNKLHIGLDNEEDFDYLINRINDFLKSFSDEDKLIRTTFATKIKELEESNNYECTEEINEYIDAYNEIISKFDKYYAYFSKEENQKASDSESFLEEYIDKLDFLYDKLKKLRLKISRITFIKIESEEKDDKSDAKTVQFEKTSYIFFNGTETKSELKVKYKSLVKIYHPDSVTGDTVKFQILQKEYEDLNSVT